MHTTRPKRSLSIQSGYGRSSSVTGHSPEKLVEGQLFDLMAGSNQHRAVIGGDLENVHYLTRCSLHNTAAGGDKQTQVISFHEESV